MKSQEERNKQECQDLLRQLQEEQRRSSDIKQVEYIIIYTNSLFK
jgi:hypothetical protein